MRFALLLGLGLLASHADADVYRGRVHGPPAAGIAGPPQISNTLYINDCRPGGCALQPGFDDSRTNHSSIAFGPTTMSPWPHGDVLWTQVVDCVRQTFRPFDIDVVTTDPGAQTSHFEVMVAGSFAELNPELEGAGGVAPFVGCEGSDDNVISFVFAQQQNDLEYLCGAIAQEAAHVWGLDHELNALDPMTYLNLGSLKRFQNDDAQCGTIANRPEPCACGGSTQNSYAYLEQLFGATELPPAQVTFTSPADDAWVRPGFPVHVNIDSVLGATRATLRIDGTEVSSVSPGPFAFNAPLSLAGGTHELSAVGIDGGNRSATASITVHVTAACSASAPCADDLYCIGGFCIPGADVEGGLGAECLGNEACITNACASGDGRQRCVGACNEDRSCPSGFYCTGPEASSFCWPEEDGGCTTAPGPSPSSPFFLAIGIGVVVVLRRRR